MKIKWVVLISVIVISFVGFIYFFGVGGAIAGFFETILIYVLFNPDKTAGYLASFYKINRNINFWFEKNAVEKRLESTISLASKKINEEGVMVLPHGVDIKWVEPIDRGAFLKEDNVVVCLEQSINEAKNLAIASMLYTSEDLIRESQRFIDSKVLKSLFLATSRKMLMIDRRIGALKFLNAEFLEPEILKYPSIKNYVEVIEKLDSEGCLTRLLIKELSELDAKLSPATSNLRAEQETVSFMQIMKRLAEKQKEVDINPSHRGEVIDITIMLVAKKGVIDPSRYIKFAEKCWKEGAPTLYVLARAQNIRVAAAAVMVIKTKGIYRVEKEWRFHIPKKRGGYDSYIAVLSRIQK